MFERMFRPGPVSNRPRARYGFGWYLESFQGENLQWHSGTTCGFSTHFTRLPKRQLALVVLANRQRVPLRGVVHRLASTSLEREA